MAGGAGDEVDGGAGGGVADGVGTDSGAGTGGGGTTGQPRSDEDDSNRASSNSVVTADAW
jgi:hypothetical protein